MVPVESHGRMNGSATGNGRGCQPAGPSAGGGASTSVGWKRAIAAGPYRWTVVQHPRSVLCQGRLGVVAVVARAEERLLDR